MGPASAARYATAACVLALAACTSSSHPIATPTSTPGTPDSSSAPTQHPTATATPGSGATSPSTTPASAATSPVPTLPAPAWVAVSVSTVWRSPAAPRAVDAPALAAPARIREWLSAMTLDQRRDLSGRADTQTLLGERVTVLARQGAWAQVVVPDQPTPLDTRGYPGWVPWRQLSLTEPAPAPQVATVVVPTTWLYDVAGTRAFEVSFATRLPLHGVSADWVTVGLPAGGSLRVQRAAVAVSAASASALAPSGADVVRVARMFTGLPYLWAGTSGFGFDCSGLTHLDYRAHGLTIPRDADAQAVRGVAVARDGLRMGDLMFYARSGYVHHVSIYAGDGSMVQSPQTGSTVQVVSVGTQPYSSEYAGARRYI